MYNFLYETFRIFLISKLFTKIIETFWSRNATGVWVLANFELKIHNDF